MVRLAREKFGNPKRRKAAPCKKYQTRSITAERKRDSISNISQGTRKEKGDELVFGKKEASALLASIKDSSRREEKRPSASEA